MKSKLFMAGLFVVLMAGPAYPQKKEILQLQADMINLTKTMNQLQTTVDQNNAVMKGLVEKMTDTVNSLTASVQKINQAVDGIKTQNDRETGDLRTIVTTLNSLNTNMTELQEGLSSVRSQINSVSREMTTIKTTTEPLQGPNDAWRSAMLDATVGNYDLAISEYKEFIAKFGNDARAADAQLAIADALSSQKKYDQAITDYDLFLQKYPGHDKTGAALYKKGLALAELNQTPQAIQTLEKVVKEFPNTSEAEGAKLKLKELQPAQRRSR
ncbi:MAG TPA: tetratricopeptide repeat protein [Terriglobia bacterium]|nr:tetratricopeptide repeat protein [Terriglobia bacterium]